MNIDLSKMTPQQIIEGVKNGTIKSERFETFGAYLKWTNQKEKITFTNTGDIVIYVQHDEDGKSIFATSDESQVSTPYAVTFLKDPNPEYLIKKDSE